MKAIRHRFKNYANGNLHQVFLPVVAVRMM